MGTALQDFNPVLMNPVDQTVRVVNPPAPVTLQIALERFGLSNTRMSVPVNIL